MCCNSVKPCAAARRCRVINPSTAALFSAAFSQNVTPDPGCADTEALSSQFLDTCKIAIGCAAPLKSRQRKVKSEPWLNETTHTARRRAERKWKKDILKKDFMLSDAPFFGGF